MKRSAKKMRFTFKSFDKKSLDKLISSLVEYLKTRGFEYSSPIWLPRKIEIETVLRSPHVDKKSREQFVRITHKAFVDIETQDQESLVKYLEQFDIPHGIGVSAKVI